MSDQKPTTVTRRRALSASLAGLLAAGAASALPTPAVVVQAPQTLPLDREPLAAWLAEYRRQEDVLSERHNAAFEAIRARIDGSDAWKLTDDLDVVIGLLSGLERDRLFALLIAHL